MTERQIRATIAAVLAQLAAGCDHRSVAIEEASVAGPDASSPRVDGIPPDQRLPPRREISVVPPYMAPEPDLFPAPPPVGAYGVPPPLLDAGFGLMYAAPSPKKD